jgi:putative Mg2+ transporter-C (MgtC) family protein
MPLHPSWTDLAVRLLLTALAGALIGANREGHGRAAGMRTTMLVGLAAAVSMIQANLLLDLEGKSPSSFVVMDLMRLPLGILTGIGFIGAGTILRRDMMVSGLTTAATLWFSTVMGLCFGGGQVILGFVAFVLALLILWALKPMEKLWSHDLQGTLTVFGPNLTEETIQRHIADSRGKLLSWREAGVNAEGEWRTCDVKWRKTENSGLPPFVQALGRTPGILRVEWKLTGHGS